jgi:hypothetical protein
MRQACSAGDVLVGQLVGRVADLPVPHRQHDSDHTAEYTDLKIENHYLRATGRL